MNLMNLLNIIKTIIYYTTGILWYIYMRFINEKLPKDIPFNLTELVLYFLIYLCCIYMYIILRHVKPKEPQEYIKKAFEILFKPLTILDTIIKNNSKINPRYLKVLSICFIFQIIPRILLILILVIDIFY
jgi:hypothetical protein